jgi:hypothetical protein
MLWNTKEARLFGCSRFRLPRSVRASNAHLSTTPSTTPPRGSRATGSKIDASHLTAAEGSTVRHAREAVLCIVY